MRNTFIKNIAHVLLFLLVIALNSCNKEQSRSVVTGLSSQKIRITGADANTTTKTTLNGLVTSWIASTDKVGIYSSQARTTTGGAGSAVLNSEFTAASSAFSSGFSGTMYWGAPNTQHTFFAYYPWTSGSAPSTAVPVSLSASQTQSEAGNTSHIGSLDFMVATPATVTSPSNTDVVANEVNLNYNHLFTILEFQIKGSGELKAVKLVANTTLAFSGGTINITQSTPATEVAYTFVSQTGKSNETVVTLTTPATLTSTDTDTKVYMVINPNTPEGKCLIGVQLDGGTWKYLEKAVPSGGFKRGVKYIVTVDASAATLENVVVGAAGKIWMDRNLGASRVATSSTDTYAHGYLYQWGRLTDGHQLRTGIITNTPSSTDIPGHGNFIISYVNPMDWRSPQNAGLWQGVSGKNNPCPSGFRLPTEAEWNNERLKWTTQNAAGAYSSPLKLTMAGYHSYRNEFIYDTNSYGYYWSSTVSGSYSRCLQFRSDFVDFHTGVRGQGSSVRCIKD